MRMKKNTPDIPKHSKKFYNDIKSFKSKSQHSILQKHNIRLDEFQKKHQSFQELGKKIKDIESEIKNMSSNISKDDTTNKTISNLNHKMYKYKSQLLKLLK